MSVNFLNLWIVAENLWLDNGNLWLENENLWIDNEKLWLENENLWIRQWHCSQTYGFHKYYGFLLSAIVFRICVLHHTFVNTPK